MRDRRPARRPAPRRTARITSTKRRRAAGVLAPVPSPKDFTQHGITFPGVVEGDLLQQAAVGDHGQNVVEFDWTPTSKTLTIRPLCTSPDLSRMIRVTLDGLTLSNDACHGSIAPVDGWTFAGPTRSGFAPSPASR